MELRPGWISEQPEVFDAVMARWRSKDRLKRVASEEHLPRVKLLETKWLAECIIDHCRSVSEGLAAGASGWQPADP